MTIGAHSHVNGLDKEGRVKQSPYAREEIEAITNKVDIDKAFVSPFNEVNSRVTFLANVHANEIRFRSPPSKERKHS